VHLHLDTDDLDKLAELVAEKLAAKMQPQTGADKLLTESEAAQLLRVQPHTLRDARRREVLEFHRVGRFVRYSREQLDSWLQSQKCTETQ
jgi:excisionase family DNA binding protein